MNKTTVTVAALRFLFIYFQLPGGVVYDDISFISSLSKSISIGTSLSSLIVVVVVVVIVLVVITVVVVVVIAVVV